MTEKVAFFQVWLHTTTRNTKQCVCVCKSEREREREKKKLIKIQQRFCSNIDSKSSNHLYLNNGKFPRSFLLSKKGVNLKLKIIGLLPTCAVPLKYLKS